MHKDKPRKVPVYIKTLDDGAIVHTIEVTSPVNERQHERFMRGLLAKTDPDRFFVDDSAVDAR